MKANILYMTNNGKCIVSTIRIIKNLRNAKKIQKELIVKQPIDYKKGKRWSIATHKVEIEE